MMLTIDKMWTFYSLVILLSVMQVQNVLATGCNIVSVTSPSASTLDVVWNSYAGASVYLLDLRVVNSTNIAPVVVMLSVPITHRVVQGLRPGHVYQVTLKVFQYLTVVCTDVEISMTVPATSQITFSKAISSTSIKFEWSTVKGADSYTLFVEELFSFPAKKYNQTFTTLKGQVDGLTPSTTYNCYVYSYNSAGSSARSNIRTITTLVQPPTGVNLVPTGKSTARVTWNAVSKVLLYQVKVSDDDNPSNAPVIRNTSLTSMDISNLEPCSTYTVGVSSVNVFLVPGEASNVTHTTATINPVTTFSVDYSCSTGMVTVTWNLVFGANSYRATAVDGTGESLNCTSASSSCQITMLKCGEKYRVTVTAISDDCESTSTNFTLFETVPCAPANLHTLHDCSSNVIVFSWQHTNNTFYYVATAVDNTGKATQCRTVDNSCYFTNTGCGQFYTYNVYAVSSECNSEISQSEFVRTSPCLPTNVRTAPECRADMLITTWDSAAGALSYTVEAQGNTGETYICTSSSNSCAVTGVPCGEHLSVWITASNDNCSTNKVLGEVAQTVPCTPTNISASVDCSQDSARVNWTTNIGAIFYIAIAQDANGNTHSCNSLGTNCLIEGLRCGQNYTASVIGTNLQCNSTASEEVTFLTAPCPPTNIEAFRDCDANHALIVWQNHQPTGLYTATIEDQSGAQLSCTSNTVNNCKITSLPCGKSYSVAVTYSDGNCPSTSTSISMDSVPCGPEDVRASVTCVTGELTVTWNISVPAENYTTVISNGMGRSLYCNSTETQCSTGGLLCGSSYGVIVFSVTGKCYSLPSTEVTVQTLPCPPTNVTAVRTCAPDPIPVSWVASDSAKYYTAVATSSGGHRSECSTNTTSCSLPTLQCGEVYTIGVSGADDNCTGPLSNTVSLNTEPCAPSNVSSQLMCSAGIAQVSWAPSANAASYNVKATSSGQILTCTSSTPNCTLSNLVCGQAYDVRVTATDGTCVSSYSAPFTQDQVPCAPQNVSTNLLCGTNDLMVSWILSPEPLNYSVTAVPLDGNISSVTCRTDTASCSLSALQCGQTYNVSVKASSGSCSGPYSSPQTVQTAPCSPQSLTAVTDCGTKSLLASWIASLGATTYTATVTGPNGFSDTCSSSNLTCSVSGLQCASQYNITVTSEDGHCTSAPIQTVITTGPCDPVNVTSNLHCGSDTAMVSWVAAPGAVAYTVVAQEGSSQNYISCRSNTTSCQLNQLQCGKVYNLTVVAEDATCNSTGGTRAVLMTAPCSPFIQNSTQMCGTNSSSLSWESMADAVGYIVNATATSGHKVSCSSATATCTLTDLLCSETYTATVTARGSQCDSAPGPNTSITTVPCSPAITSKQYTCGTNTAVFSWTDPMGSLSFLAQVAGEGYQDSCQTTNTSCLFQNLPCGLDFNVTVEAQGAQCNSIPTVSEPFETVPCAPQNVSATLVCFNHSALVTWVGSSSAVGYNVTLTGQDGHTHHCHTNTTSCQVPDIHCGETYDITVTPYSKTCTGNPSAVYSFIAGLCAPSNVTVSPACEDSIVSWSPVTGAEMYIATATADDGHTHTCSSNYSNSCNFTDLHCGETYSVDVVTVDRGCRSEPSSAAVLRTALCPAANLMGQVSCDTNTLTLTWNQNPVSGTNYTLQTERMGGTFPPSVLTTSNTSHTLTNLLCGQRYAFRIAAHDGNCRSSYSPPIEISTAPCQPTNFTARVDCGTNRGNFSWVESIGAGFYTVEVTGEHGHVASCSSNDTSCAVKLHCGRLYSATLVASTESCNSTKHADIHFESAPCLPDNVVAEVECNTNVMNVSWTQTTGSDDYTAWAISTDGHRASCNSTSNSCSIHNLQCGKVYEVAVTSSSIHCSVIAGSDYKVQSAPCKPENTTVDQNCSSNVMTVKWKQSSSTQNYTVEATSAAGVNSTCVSTESSCTFLDLSCGQLYTFTVMGHTNVCMSEISSSIEKITAPCPPTNVSAKLNCTTHDALVSWTTAATATATAYSIQATSTNGHSSSCSGTGTSCNLNSLVCGQEYSVVVEAMHTGCPGPASPPATLTTEPCVPTNISVFYNVSTAQVMWGSASGASSYSVEAVTDHGSTVTCNTTNNSCFLNGMQCGQIYNVTVTAHNLACDSVTSEIHRLMTEPCPPTNIQANMACEQLTATVSWDQSDLAVGYVAYLDNQNGHYTSCAATNTHCTVSGLTCGTVYSVWVKALGQQYNSSDSTVVSLTSAPCLPREVEVEVDCNSDGAAVVSWNTTYGTANFSLSAIVSGSLQTLCTTQQNSCNVNSLTCGETYNISLTASNDQCSLTVPMRANLTTRPCPPQRLAVDLQCGSRTAVLSWEERPDVELYVATAIKASGGEVKRCNSTGSTCQFPSLACGETYNFTIRAHSQGCSSQASNSVSIQTEPCQPVIVSVQALCQSKEVQISWHQASGVVNYLVAATGSLGYVENYNTTQTLLSATLPCGQDYNVTVQGQGSECDSIPSGPAFFKTPPCIPQDVTTYVQCESKVGSVSWGPSDGAESYIVTATGLDGHTHQCLTNTTSCTWNDLHCGEDYTVVVRAKDDNCTSLPSNSSVIHMDPCVPQNLVTSVDCSMKVVSLSWDASNGTNLYMVSAEAGNQTSALTTNVTTAHFSDLTCGQNYSLTVTPHSQHCPGSSSALASVQTWPCPPSGVSTMQDCLSGIVMVTWQASNGSNYYAVTMQTDTGISQMSMSDSNQSSFPGLMCGYNFSVSVTASNQRCNTTSSHTTSLQSVPCAPTNVSVVMDCANNTAAVSWSASRGAVQYSVTARSSHGNISCQTSDLSCSLNNLMCGTNYTVQVVSMGDDCSSIPSQALVLNSAPCPPQNVSAQLSCSSNDLMISWDAIRDADHFLVSVMAENGGISESCNTTDTACSISSVSCGKTFTIHVTSVRGDCRSQPSQTHSILSAPCQPQGIRGNIDCVTNSAWISWDGGPGADSHTVSATGGEDYTANCTTSSNTTCEVEDLACGVLYNFSVIAKNSQCESQPSATIELQTAPCSLSGITAIPQCHNSSILVMWELMEGSSGNTEYIATAEASDRTYLSCNDTGTSCYLHGARCDLHYTVIVAASSDQCSSMRSPPYRVSMEPCPPRDVMVSTSCEDHSALVSWTPSPIAETYHVVAMAVDGHVHTCNTSSSNCSVSELHCDQQYTVFVTASHENCSSMASENTTLNTGPCQPGGLSVTFNCNNQSALLSWTPSDNTVDYYGCAQSGSGDMLYCQSADPTCTIEGLDCGTVYNFSVQASDGSCNSSFTDPVQSGAAPCPPDTVEVQLLPMQSAIQVLRFSWSQISCSDTEYMLTLTGNLLGDNLTQFELSSYWTSMTYFEIPLPCSSSYVATVQSRSSAATSDPSTPYESVTAPCPPSGVVYSGNSTFATISWQSSVFATTYTVYDIGVTPKAQLCRVAGLSCSLSNITSTNLVIIASNAAGDSEAQNITNVVPQGRRRRDLSEMQGGGLSAPVLDVKGMMSTAVFVEWSQVDDASYYSLIITKQDGSSEPQEEMVYGESIIVPDLSPDSTYCFSVSASISATSGPESEPVCVQTGQGLAM
ncbi:mucin-4 isoform X2 [Lates calcarifer]|uniref:Mucin-4 isoform X2 n=1 Tax=Lates calcarifer TaxID=8187 RepID=A0AAJ7PMG0_LATCA|nr:mucin-4 isoform X2 [Lates calcarifer]